MTESKPLHDATIQELESQFMIGAVCFHLLSPLAQPQAFGHLASIRTTIMERYTTPEAQPTDEIIQVVNRMGNVLARHQPLVDHGGHN